jgi:hypothetical protein
MILLSDFTVTTFNHTVFLDIVLIGTELEKSGREVFEEGNLV